MPNYAQRGRRAVPVLAMLVRRHGVGVYSPATVRPVPTMKGELLLAKTREAAVAAYRRSRFGRYRAMRGLDLDRQIAANWIGTAESVASMIGAVMEQGIDHFNVLHVVADSLEERFEQMRMFMEDVVPRLG